MRGRRGEEVEVFGHESRASFVLRIDQLPPSLLAKKKDVVHPRWLCQSNNRQKECITITSRFCVLPGLTTVSTTVRWKGINFGLGRVSPSGGTRSRALPSIASYPAIYGKKSLAPNPAEKDPDSWLA